MFYVCLQELYKKTRSILNKLTPQKFQILLSQMQALKIDTEDKLKGVIDLVFEKVSVDWWLMFIYLSLICNKYEILHYVTYLLMMIIISQTDIVEDK